MPERGLSRDLRLSKQAASTTAPGPPPFKCVKNSEVKIRMEEHYYLMAENGIKMYMINMMKGDFIYLSW